MLAVVESVELVVPFSSPFALGARSATEACEILQANGFEVSLTALRWFQNIGLIDKPAKDGRNAIYSSGILDEIASVRMLQVLYGRTVEELKELRRRRITFTETVRHLLRLERQFRGKVKKSAASREGSSDAAWEHAAERLNLVVEFFHRVIQQRVRPGRLIPRDHVPVVIKLQRRKRH